MNEQNDEIEFEITLTVFARKSRAETPGQQIERLIDDFNAVMHEKHPNINADCFWVGQKPERKP